MKKSNSSKRLLLSVERIRDLQPGQLKGVAGGWTCLTTCAASGDDYLDPVCKTTQPSCAITGGANSGL